MTGSQLSSRGCNLPRMRGMANVRVFATSYYRQIAGEIRNSVGPKLLLSVQPPLLAGFWQRGGVTIATLYKWFGQFFATPVKAGPYIPRILIQISVASQLVPHCKEIKLTF